MAKRLTDTEKWNDDWYISLSNDYRIIWQWLLDNCNHAGICKRSIKLVNLMCNTTIQESELIENMDGRVIAINNLWFIPKFLKFQYPTLQSNKPVIISVIKELEKHNLFNHIPESFGNHYLIIKDKSKDKDKDSLQPEKNKNHGEQKFSGNFKAQGEELFAKRITRGNSPDSK
jgi:hypothetical protein